MRNIMTCLLITCKVFDLERQRVQYMQTSNFEGPTRKCARSLVKYLLTTQYQIEGLQGIFQNQRVLYLEFV
jgi:hypothetical protein